MVYSPFKQAGASSQLVPVCLPEDDEYQANFNILTQISHRTSQLMSKFPLPHGTTASSLPILMQSIGAILLSTSDQDAKSQINMITLCCDEVAAARLADSTSPPNRAHPVQGELDKIVETILALEAEDTLLEQCLFRVSTPAHHPQHPATLVLNGEAGYHESIPSDLILLPENALSRLDIDTVKLAPQSQLMDHLTSVITEQLTDAGFDRNSPRQLLRLPTSHVAVAVLLDPELGLWGLPLLHATDHVDANELDSTASAHREWQSLAWHLCHFPSDQSILVAQQAPSPPINVSADCSHPRARHTNVGTVPLTPAPQETAGDRVFVST